MNTVRLHPCGKARLSDLLTRKSLLRHETLCHSFNLRPQSSDQVLRADLKEMKIGLEFLVTRRKMAQNLDRLLPVISPTDQVPPLASSIPTGCRVPREANDHEFLCLQDRSTATTGCSFHLRDKSGRIPKVAQGTSRRIGDDRHVVTFLEVARPPSRHRMSRLVMRCILQLLFIHI
jgi:hypothetical protein